VGVAFDIMADPIPWRLRDTGGRCRRWRGQSNPPVVRSRTTPFTTGRSPRRFDRDGSTAGTSLIRRRSVPSTTISLPSTCRHVRYSKYTPTKSAILPRKITSTAKPGSWRRRLRLEDRGPATACCTLFDGPARWRIRSERRLSCQWSHGSLAFRNPVQGRKDQGPSA